MSQLLQQSLVNDPRYIEHFSGLTIYGVAGTNGSGKDLLMDILEESGFLIYRTGDNLRQISKAVFQTTKRGGNESPMGRIANAERAFYPGGMAELGLLDWWVKAGHLPLELRPRGLAIGSIRSVSEVERLKQLGGQLIVVDAPAEVRYERLKHRGRYYEKSISYEDFLKEEAAELAEGETDPTKFGMAAVIQMADMTLENATAHAASFKKIVQEKLLVTSGQ
ncbi:MAG TPA: hypothetical protein VFZ58_04055 [Candidatus Saccharimonadales bacterium]